jgi:hypothetical protein
MTDDPDEDDGQAAKQLTGRYRGLKPRRNSEPDKAEASAANKQASQAA